MCRTHEIPVFCHPSHEKVLSQKMRGMEKLATSNLLQHFSADPFVVGDLLVKPVEVSHDDEASTFGFVLSTIRSGQAFKACLITDLGYASDELAEDLADSNLLAIEHNHDLELLWQSARPNALKSRIRSRRGHLSNHQAAQLLLRVMEASKQGMPQHVVLMHMSQECNEASLALSEIKETLRDTMVQPRCHVASQHFPISVILSMKEPDSDLEAQIASV